jgi:uncharacterized protein YndB with AHSA1/START domain
MAEYRFELRVKAPPERVFEAWIDLDLMPNWVEGVTRVGEVSGPVDMPGTTYTIWFGRMRSRVEVLEVDRPRLFRSRIAGGLLTADNEARLERDGDGTRLIQTFRTHGLMSRLWARIFATGSWRGSFRGELDTFARLVEAQV